MKSNASNQWSVGHGTLQGKSVHFSINRALDSLLLAGRHPFEVRFSIDIASPSEAGLPVTDEEVAFLDLFEDELVPAIESFGESYFGARVTSGGIRDFVFYTNQPDPIIAHFEEKIRPSAARNIELLVAKNDWKVYRLFAEEPKRPPMPKKKWWKF